MSEDEGPMIWEYQRAGMVEKCYCDGPGVLGGISVKDDGVYCSSCGKKLKIENYILVGCPKCAKPKFKELDMIEKETYPDGVKY
jgi:Zn finger protein HypA/HybF involved in hydrogenase expression